RRVTPRVVESRDLDAGAEPIGRQFPALKRNPDARVLLDEVVVVAEAESGGDTMVPSTHRNVERAAPALFRVIDEFRPRRRERNPPRALLLAELENDPDAAALAAARDASLDGVAGALGLEQAFELVGFIVVEPSAHQRLQPIAQRAADVGVRNPLYLDALDDVARVDVLDQAVVIADACDEKDHASLAVRPRHISDRGDDIGLFALDARGDLHEPFAIERFTREGLELTPQAGAETVARQAGEINGLDDRAVARFDVLPARRARVDVLRVRGLPWRA